MPPRAKITEEMVVDAAFQVTRADGEANVNARTVAKRLGCSTQPVMYHFAKIEDLKRAVYEKTGRFHTEYIMNVPPSRNIMLGIGLNYIRFSVEEPNLFRFLFQSGFATENSLFESCYQRNAKGYGSYCQADKRGVYNACNVRPRVCKHHRQ